MVKKTKGGLLGLTLLSSIVLVGSTSNAEELTENKVTANLVSGGMTLEAFDVDLGTLSIGENISSKNLDIAKIRDYSGGDGWTLNVKHENYNETKDSLKLNLSTDNGIISLTNDDNFFSTGKSENKELVKNSNISATWGNNPKVGEYKANLTWTLSPGMKELPVDVNTEEGEKDGNVVVTEDGRVFVNLKDYVIERDDFSIPYEAWIQFDKGQDNGYILTGIGALVDNEDTDAVSKYIKENGKLPNYDSSILTIFSEIKFPATINNIPIVEIGDNFINVRAPNVEGVASLEITLPKYLKKIGNNSFNSEQFLNFIFKSWPESIETIGDNSFSGYTEAGKTAIGTANLVILNKTDDMFKHLKSVGKNSMLSYAPWINSKEMATFVSFLPNDYEMYLMFFEGQGFVLPEDKWMTFEELIENSISSTHPERLILNKSIQLKEGAFGLFSPKLIIDEEGLELSVPTNTIGSHIDEQVEDENNELKIRSTWWLRYNEANK